MFYTDIVEVEHMERDIATTKHNAENDSDVQEEEEEEDTLASLVQKSKNFGEKVRFLYSFVLFFFLSPVLAPSRLTMMLARSPLTHQG